MDVFNTQQEIEGYSRLVPIEEIEKKEFNLNIPRYIDNQDSEDIQDIEAHLKGGIPNKDLDDLKAYWQVYPALRDELFDDLRDSYSQLQVEKDQVKQTIYSHPEFESYADEVESVFTSWQQEVEPTLKGIAEDTRPKKLIRQISEKLIQSFESLHLIDKYDVYQHLMTYWKQTMQDDVYLIAANDWQPQVEPILTKSGNKKGWKSALIPKKIVINKYFEEEAREIEKLRNQLEQIEQESDELEQEHTGEGGILEEAKSEAGNVTLSNIRSKISEYKGEPEFSDELEVFERYLELHNRARNQKKKIKKAEKELDKQLLEKYQEFDENEVKTLVVEDKWLANLQEAVQDEMDRISRNLTERIKELVERYEKPLPELEEEVEELEKKVKENLEEMGFAW